MFKKAPSDIQFLAVTFMVVLLLGGPTVWSLVSEDHVTPAEEIAMTAVPTAKERAPASLPPSRGIAKTAPLTQFDLKCSTKVSKDLAVNDHFVQIQGKTCMKHFDAEKLEIVNKSNGYTASVFVSGADQYQTDLIKLQNGKNEISIRYVSGTGHSVDETVTINAPQI